MINKHLSKEKLPFIIIIIIGLFFVISFYGKILTNANNFMFTNSGDGIKNYFTYAYHIKYDSTYLNFEGMNYPYGEHFLYTDCHPIIANTFKFLSSKLTFFDSHSVGLLNLILILSILLTFVICYFLLVELKLNKWFSVIFSFSITLLAPQIFRLDGHLALSYSFAIPLSWLLLIKCFKGNNKLLIVLFLNNLFWMFIHAYLGMIILSFLLSLVFVKILTDKNRKQNILNYIWQGAAIILPIVLFYAFSRLTDTHDGRTTNPAGFFLYNAEFDDIFLPHGKPFRPLFDKLTGNAIKLEWEAWGYVGIVNTIFLLALIVISIISSFRAKSRIVLKGIFENKILNISMISALLVLLFAMAIPFRQFPALLEYFPIIKQFRATGRFVWPFYFVFTIFGALVFQKLFYKLKDKKGVVYGILFVLVIVGINIAEGLPYHFNVSKSITQYPNLFKADLLPLSYKNAISNIIPDDYQAIISLPFYYQGSESFARPRNDDAVRNSIVISYHTGIPIICANLTRTSIGESKKIVQLVSPNYYEKLLIEDMTSNKPILIVKTETNLTQYEQLILNKGKSIFKEGSIELLVIEKKKLFSDDGKKVLTQFQEKMSNLYEQNSFFTSDSSSVLFYDSFENTKSDTSFRGKGSYHSVKKGKNTYAEFSPNTFEEGKEYHVSMWMYNGEPDALNLWFRFIIEEYDEVNDSWYSTTFFPEQSEVISDNWSLIEGVFKVNSSKNLIYIVSKGKEDSKALLHADDLLIKEKGIDVYKIEDKDSSLLFFNNHRINIR